MDLSAILTSARIPDEENTIDTINPWVDEPPNALKQTGGDWYSTLLRASLSGKVIHGVNLAPSTELLGQAGNARDMYDSVGVLHFDDDTFCEDKLGSRVSDRFYKNHQYRGTHTHSGTSVGYESSVWDPANKARTASATMLAAAITAHGCTREEARKVVNSITSDEIDAEVVNHVVLPASHIKRDMATVSRASHKVYSQGTLQRAIVWDDSRLNTRGAEVTAAFDWGRITALARYIGEANAQVCPTFREVAQKTGLAYHLIRNAYAYVSEEDYQIPSSLFANVPTIDPTKYGIPRIKESYILKEREMLAAIARSISEDANDPAGDAFRTYLSIIKKSKRLHYMKHKVKTAEVDTIRNPGFVEHKYHGPSASNYLRSPVAPWGLLANAIATRREHDKAFASVLNKYMVAVDDLPRTRFNATLDGLVSLIFDKSTWHLAKVAACRLFDAVSDTEEKESGLRAAQHELTRMKCTIFGIPIHLDNDPLLDAELIARARPHAVRLLRQSSASHSLSVINRDEVRDVDIGTIADTLLNIAEKGQHILPEIQETCALYFKQCADLVYQSSREDRLQLCANYFFTYKALRCLGPSTCALKVNGYIDGGAPRNTFVYRSAKKAHKHYNLGKATMEGRTYPNARLLASGIQDQSDLRYNIVDATNFATRIMDDVVADLLLGRAYEPPKDLPTCDEVPEVPDSPDYDAGGVMKRAELEDVFGSFFDQMVVDVNSSRLSEYEITLNTYESPEMAEEYAKANGYTSFREAYDDLKTACGNSQEHVFVINATAYLVNKAAMERAGTHSPKKQKVYHPVM